MTALAAVEYEVRPMPGYTLDSTADEYWFVVPTGDGADAAMSLMLTRAMIADVAYLLLGGSELEAPHDYGVSWKFEAVTPLGLRVVLAEE